MVGEYSVSMMSGISFSIQSSSGFRISLLLHVSEHYHGGRINFVLKPNSVFFLLALTEAAKAACSRFYFVSFDLGFKI